MPDVSRLRPMPDDECERVLWLANLLWSALDERDLKGEWFYFNKVEKRRRRDLVTHLDKAYSWANRAIIPKESPLSGICPLAILNDEDEDEEAWISLAGVIKEVRSALSNHKEMYLERIQRVKRVIAALRHHAAEKLGICDTGAPGSQSAELLDNADGATSKSRGDEGQEAKLRKPTKKPGEGQQEPARHLSAWKRLKIIPHTGGNDLAQLDGCKDRLRAGAADFLTTLQKAKGEMVLAATLTDKCGTRADRIYKSLPTNLQAIIDPPGKSRQGYRML